MPEVLCNLCVAYRPAAKLIAAPPAFRSTIIRSVFFVSFAISNISPARRSVQMVADEHGISGSVFRVSSTVVRVLAVSTIRGDVVRFVEQVKIAFPSRALGSTDSPDTPLDPASAIAESIDPELIRTVIAATFRSVVSRFHAQNKELSPNDVDTASSSQSGASRGSGGAGGARPGVHKFDH